MLTSTMRPILYPIGKSIGSRQPLPRTLGLPRYSPMSESQLCIDFFSFFNCITPNATSVPMRSCHENPMWMPKMYGCRAKTVKNPAARE